MKQAVAKAVALAVLLSLAAAGGPAWGGDGAANGFIGSGPHTIASGAISAPRIVRSERPAMQCPFCIPYCPNEKERNAHETAR